MGFVMVDATQLLNPARIIFCPSRTIGEMEGAVIDDAGDGGCRATGMLPMGILLLLAAMTVDRLQRETPLLSIR